MKRKEGFYWVRIRRLVGAAPFSWTVGEWDGLNWFLVGDDKSIPARKIEIGSYIVPPAHDPL